MSYIHKSAYMLNTIINLSYKENFSIKILSDVHKIYSLHCLFLHFQCSIKNHYHIIDKSCSEHTTFTCLIAKFFKQFQQSIM
jgi:hypothetical protein